MRRPLLVALTALALTSAANANEIKWDNNIIANGFAGRALSPPVFPAIRVADDFEVATGGTVLKDAHFGIIEDNGWLPGDVLEVTIYAQTNQGPGAAIARRTGAFDRMSTGRVLFGRREYHYWMDFDEGIALDSGKYWIGVRNPNAAGAGTNYWLTSDGGPDGMDSKTGWFSLNAGESWQDQGVNWQHAFELTPAPGALALFGMASLLAGRRRRR